MVTNFNYSSGFYLEKIVIYKHPSNKRIELLPLEQNRRKSIFSAMKMSQTIINYKWKQTFYSMAGRGEGQFFLFKHNWNIPLKYTMLFSLIYLFDRPKRKKKKVPSFWRITKSYQLSLPAEKSIQPKSKTALNTNHQENVQCSKNKNNKFTEMTKFGND